MTSNRPSCANDFNDAAICGQILHLVKEDQRLAFLILPSRLNQRNTPQDGRNRTSVLNNLLELFTKNKIDLVKMRISTSGKMANGFRLTNLPSPFNQKRLMSGRLLPYL